MSIGYPCSQTPGQMIVNQPVSVTSFQAKTKGPSFYNGQLNPKIQNPLYILFDCEISCTSSVEPETMETRTVAP